MEELVAVPYLIINKGLKTFIFEVQLVSILRKDATFALECTIQGNLVSSGNS